MLDHIKYRATARDVTHRNQCKKFTSAWQDRCTKPKGTNVCPTRVTVPALPEFLYEWMPLHLFSSVATLVREESQNGLYKVSDCV